MGGRTLVKQGEDRLARVREKLSADQILFAEWLALPHSQRAPKSQQEFAIHLGLHETTLCNWKKIPEIWQIRDGILDTKGRELVSEAMAVMENLLKSTNLKIKSEAARDILDRWAEPAKHAFLIASIKDLYEQYH